MYPSRPAAPRFDHRRKGFTLIELMIVLALLSGFVTAVFGAVIVGLRAAHSADDRADIRLQLAKTLEQLSREASVAANVDQAQDQRFQFDADIDGDGSNESNINYVVQNGDLVRIYSGDTVTLVGDLTALDFDYVDLNNAALSAPVGAGSRDDIRVVQITLTAAKGTESISLATAVYLRNNR